MARDNLSAARTKPEHSALLTLSVLRRERVSPNFVRVTLGGDDLARFTPLGYDQWFRLFIPVAQGSLDGAPDKLTVLSYLKYLTVSKGRRPVLRNYTVRAFRPEGPELDVDFVVHGSPDDGTAGPATAWALTCAEGDQVGILDEGTGFALPDGVRQVLLVADETGLPAIEGILASLPADVTGRAVVEVPEEGDRRDLAGPSGVEVTWVVRADATAVPGAAARAEVESRPLPEGSFYGWAVGESALPVGLRRHWVGAGVPKEDVTFCGYWKAPKKHP